MSSLISVIVMTEKSDREEIDKLRDEVVIYIRSKEIEKVSDSEAVCLLRRVFNIFMTKSSLIIIDNTVLQITLVVIDKRLSRIEENDKSKAKISYVTITTSVSTDLSTKSATELKKQISKNALMKNRRIKELMIQIINSIEKIKLE